jgi:hypothetical protein
MLLMIPCMECQIQDGVPSGFTLVGYQDSGRYEFTCSKGHKTVTILQAQKFEVLFEIGANAINDGYYREAVSSFASSLERFHEFSVRVLLLKMQPDKPNLFDETWKPMNDLSERQSGAFIATWSVHYGEAPSMLSGNDVNFRNKVIHKGKIPTRGEAVGFGQRALDLARKQISNLRSDCENEIRQETHRHLIAARAPGDKDLRISTAGGMSIIGLAVAEGHHARSLEEALVQVSHWRQILRGLEGKTNLADSMPIYNPDGSPYAGKSKEK